MNFPVNPSKIADGRYFRADTSGDDVAADTNARGTIFGGVILSHIDLAGGIAASRQAPRNFVTRAMRGVEFIAPVYIGDVISFYTAVVREGTTSVTVKVSVEAERGREPRHRVKVTEAEVIYVAVDEAGNPTPLK